MTKPGSQRRNSDTLAVQAYANINVLVVATENITSEWYKGAAPVKLSALACLPGMCAAAWTQYLYPLGGWQHVHRPVVQLTCTCHCSPTEVPIPASAVACACSRYLTSRQAWLHPVPIP